MCFSNDIILEESEESMLFADNLFASNVSFLLLMYCPAGPCCCQDPQTHAHGMVPIHTHTHTKTHRHTRVCVCVCVCVCVF